jgi:hypothetical protein
MLYTMELGAEFKVTHYPSTDYELCYLFNLWICDGNHYTFGAGFPVYNSSVVFGASKSIYASGLLLKSYALTTWCNRQIRQLGLYLASHVLLSENQSDPYEKKHLLGLGTGNNFYFRFELLREHIHVRF